MIQDCALHGIRHHPWKGFLEHTAQRWNHSLFVKFFSLLPTTYNLLRIMKAVRPDVVQITLAAVFETPLFHLVSGVLKVPSLVVFQVASAKLRAPNVIKKVYAWGRANNQRWITVSEQNRKNICETFSTPVEQVLLIENGTELTSEFSDCTPSHVELLRREVHAELTIPETATILLTVGRLAEDKGYSDLVEIVRPLLSEFPGLKFVWVGDGEQRTALERTIRRYGIERTVILCGYRNDVVRLMCAADLLIVASRHEGGCSSVIREAMVHRLPIISSDAGGIPEVVEPMVHGRLFPAGDRARMLESVRWALQHPEQMRAMTREARKRIEQHSTERMAEKYLSALEQLSAEHRKKN